MLSATAQARRSCAYRLHPCNFNSSRVELIKARAITSLQSPLGRFEATVIDLQKSGSGKLLYIPNNADPSKSIVKVNEDAIPIDKNDIHPITTGSSKGDRTPRLICSGKILSKLHAAVISPDLGDIVKINFSPTVSSCVMFCHGHSKNPDIRDIYHLAVSLKPDLGKHAENVDGSYREEDNLAGGEYTACGYACMAGNTKNQREYWEGTKVPFLRISVYSTDVQEIKKIVGAITGEAARLLQKLVPDQVRANQMTGAEDVMCPTKHDQMRHQNSTQSSYLVSSQFIFRTIGRTNRLKGKKRKMSSAATRIALHCDETDLSTHQCLQFWPFSNRSERKNIGGPVPGSDLLLFESKTGGRAIRIKTSIEDCIVLVWCNSVEQLHGGACDDMGSLRETMGSDGDDNWSFRVIPYSRAKIQQFVDTRKTSEENPPPVIIDHKNHHIALSKSELSMGRKVAMRWGKKGILYKGTLGRMCSKDATYEGAYDILWDPTAKKKSRLWTQCKENSQFYSPECADETSAYCSTCSKKIKLAFR